MNRERDYVLGTHDEEVERLGLQHRVWRPRALRAWIDAGFTAGQTLIDLGCGPGFATLDLAEIAGAEGRVVAIDRSRRFLDVLRARHLRNVETHELDLDEDELPAYSADGAWVRWVFAFVKRPQELLAKVRRALRPGGVLVVHEYFDYRTWRVAPRAEAFERFVTTVMATWRESGGEPDIGLDLPRWLGVLGFEVLRLQPIIEVVTPSSFIWQWPKTFIEVGLERLIGLGRITDEDARQVREVIAAREADPRTLMTTPAVMEIVARCV
jgi:SAM-dependent methyltransferase